ncbi:MAG: lysophospholipid acyltransferase family protein [Acidimicrobiales bacterium]
MIPEGIGRHQQTARRILGPLVSRLWKFNVDGIENVPASGPAVLCPNHVAAIDSLFVPAVLDRSLVYVGKAEYLDDWKTRWLFPALGMIPIDRRGGDHATAALDAAREVLERGGLFGIYPEGTRSRSGKLHKGHTGAARLAVETGAPIIPVGLLGTAEIQPVDSPTPKFFKTVTIRFGRPIDVERYRHRIGDRAVYRELIDEVMYEIQQLTGLEYQHVYAGSAAATPATATTSLGSPPADSPSVPTIARPSSASVLTSDRPRSLAEVLATT